MIPRNATATAQRLAKGFPIVAVTGPRQSGKTSLARAVFADKACELVVLAAGSGR